MFFKSQIWKKEPEPVKNEDAICVQIQDEKDEAQAEKNLVANIERFITRLRMVAQQIIQFHNEQLL